MRSTDAPPTRPPNHDGKNLRAEAALKETLTKVLQRGFYGTAGIVVSVQDGTIQNVRVSVDQRVM